VAQEMGGGTFGMEELVPALDVRYPATPGPTHGQTTAQVIDYLSFRLMV